MKRISLLILILILYSCDSEVSDINKSMDIILDFSSSDITQYDSDASYQDLIDITHLKDSEISDISTTDERYSADLILYDAEGEDNLSIDVCIPDCKDKECGSDGCGNLCGTCNDDEFCNPSFKCEKKCINECDFEGQIKCTLDGKYQTCIKNENGCLVLGEIKVCPENNLCSDDLCALVQFISPRDGEELKNPVEFTLTATKNIKKVIYEADGYIFGSSTDYNSNFYYKYNFTKLGKRKITVYGYDSTSENAKQIALTSITITITEDIPDVPYFCQYKNSLYPGSTCQNTSIAMLLKYYGWNGKPDDITSEFGKDYAQSPSGLADIFNTLAKRNGISKRLIPHTDGSIQDVKNLLSRGLPVIVHGYFTSYGHVLIILGYKDGKYIVNDPAGRWSEVFKGGYVDYCDTSSYGPKIEYNSTPFEKAIATWDGSTPAPVWYHEIQ